MQPIIKQKLNLQFILKTFKKTLNYIFEVVQSLFITTSRHHDQNPQHDDMITK